MNEHFEHFKVILDDLIENDKVMRLYLQAPEDDYETLEGNYYIKALHRDVEVCMGASRMVICDPEYPYVMKFDIGNDDLGNEFCEREIYTYAAAEEAGLAEYFVRPQYIGTYTHEYTWYSIKDIAPYDAVNDPAVYNGYEMKEIQIRLSLYIYPYIKQCGLGRVGAVSESSQKAAKSIRSPLSDRSILVAEQFIEEYGIEEFMKLTSLLIAENVNDIHTGNVGRLNGRLVLIDYAGYHCLN